MNLLLWSAQAAFVMLIAAAIAQLMKSVAPAARLAFWQLTLLASLLLPVLRPWQQETITDLSLSPRLPFRAGTPVVAHAPALWQTLSPADWLLLLLAAGIVAKLSLLCTGLFKLRRYRREAQPFLADPSWAAEATLLASNAVSSPVTFGFLKPVILVPARFAELAPSLRDPILFHEILHVRRRDWLFALAEETLRSVLWFHPAIWYAIREIQLAREETVDREVVNTMNAREEYVDALLAIAGSLKGPEMATAPFFLRRRQLKQRVISIFREAKMSKVSKTRSVSALLAGCTVMALGCWFVTGALPLKAEPQEVMDGAGVSVDLNGARLMHRSPVMYPHEAVSKNVQGTVIAQLKLDGSGNVVDASITSGPDELRKAVLQSVLNWHFASDSANGVRPVVVTFSAPKTSSGVLSATIVPQTPRAEATRTIVPAAPPIPIAAIEVLGLPDAERDELLSKLTVHVGDSMTPALHASLVQAVHNFDEHLMVAARVTKGSDLILTVRTPVAFAPPPPPSPPPPSPSSVETTPKAIRIGGMVAAANLINQVPPAYPPLAKAARVQGTVRFEANIGQDGTVQTLQVVSGPPLLIKAAQDAAQQWVYKPTLLNGQPVQVITTIDINFTLSEN